MELGPQSHIKDGLSIPNSTMVVYMDPLGKQASRQMGVVQTALVSVQFSDATVDGQNPALPIIRNIP